jgi:acyl-CoA dehydrogenase
MSVFLVDLRDLPGHHHPPIPTMMNHNTTEVFFDDVVIPADALVGQEGMRVPHILDGMNAERILIASECIGDGRFFLERAVATPISARCSAGPSARTRACSSRSRRRTRAARRRPDAQGRRRRCSTPASPAAPRRTCRSCSPRRRRGPRPTPRLDTHGGFGFAAEYDVERKFRETRLYQVAPINNNLVLAYVGQNVLGLPKSY